MYIYIYMGSQPRRTPDVSQRHVNGVVSQNNPITITVIITTTINYYCYYTYSYCYCHYYYYYYKI